MKKQEISAWKNSRLRTEKTGNSGLEKQRIPDRNPDVEDQ
ncbi:hypothetical protein PBAL39_08631 [Pedobacter sp. BAL39]|nr:hypothetical protein PBAL39_08631 [Pedobacter sp. BAL39]